MKKTKENLKNNNFTKLTRSGISLIVLVITIIVIIILAAAIIISLNNNNPIMEANTARYDSDVANMQAVFTNTVAKVMAKNQATVSVSPGQINTITGGQKEVEGEVAYTLTDAQNSNFSSGKIVFDKNKPNTDTIFYTGKQLPIYAAGNTIWYVDGEGNISLEVAGTKYGNGEVVEPAFAEIVSKNADMYYGADITNYQTGNTAIDTQVKWQIFSATKKNIFLIAKDYVHYDLLPTKIGKNGDDQDVIYSLNKESDYKANFDDIVNSGIYESTNSITDTRLQDLNKIYFSYLKSNNKEGSQYNGNALAYMLDIEAWNKFKGENAEFAIGGPTLEMLVESYNKKHNVNYLCSVESSTGYEISLDGGETWENCTDSDILNPDDTLYVIKDTTKARGMWLASPSTGDQRLVMNARSDGSIYCYFYSDTGIGFRPIVCLDSSVTLKEVEGGYEIIE